MKKLHLSIFYFTILIYLEVVFRILNIRPILSLSLLNIILFSIPIAILFSLIGRMFKKEKVNKIINFLIIL